MVTGLGTIFTALVTRSLLAQSSLFLTPELQILSPKPTTVSLYHFVPLSTCRMTVMHNLRDRYRGSLLGLATGDALGTTLEFKLPGSFPPLTDMVGGGPFGLEPGQWTDDTSMALCLAESLIARRGFDPIDQLERYLRWYRDGHMGVR